MRIFTLLLILSTLMFANDYKRVAVIPADINYDKESAEEFAEILYDSVVNGIAEYNFTQKIPTNMYELRGPLLPKKKYQVQIKDAHSKIKGGSIAFMKRHKLNKLLVMDFGTNHIVHTMNKCKKLCDVRIIFTTYTADLNSSSKTMTYQYDDDSCLLSDKSTNSLNKSIARFLRK